jgi:hypothetical protein
MRKREEYLRHYTDLSALFYLLTERKLTLLNGERWEDKNDIFFLEEYRKKKELKSVLALCFIRASERFHFWKVFGAGSSGVRIRFRREDLLRAVKRPGLLTGKVDYLHFNEITKPLAVDRLPFIKRHGFQDEREFRMVYESERHVRSKVDIPIPLPCIDNIKLTPWLHHDLVSDVRKIIHSIDGCARLEVVRSKLIDNERWKRFAESAK